MRVDIVCPGDWQDSFESRMLGESVWDANITGIQDLLLLCKSYFESESGKYEQELFPYFPIYIDGQLVGEYSHGEITLDPPHKTRIVDDKFYTEFKDGVTCGLVFPIDLCLKYGINNRTVRKDEKHKWV